MAWFGQSLGLPLKQPTIERLVADHYEPVYRFAYRLSGSSADAEDLTQETFCQAQAKLSQLRDASSARGWLFSIVRNAYLHRMRSQKNGRTISLDESPEPIDRPEEELVIDPQALQAALGDLPESFRTPVILYYFEEFSYRQIAEQLAVPLGTVMSRLARAKGFLRDKLLRIEPELAAGLSEVQTGVRDRGWGRKEEA